MFKEYSQKKMFWQVVSLHLADELLSSYLGESKVLQYLRTYYFPE